MAKQSSKEEQNINVFVRIRYVLLCFIISLYYYIYFILDRITL